MLKLVLPSYEYEISFNEYIKEVINNNEQDELGNVYREDETFNQMLQRVHKRRYGIDIPSMDVPSTIYFIINNDEVVGTIDLRSYLNKSYFFKFGHIAYIIKPSCRKKGFATEALKQAIDIYKKSNIDKILIVCYKDNTASSKVIEKNGGILEREYQKDNHIIQRWWISL